MKKEVLGYWCAIGNIKREIGFGPGKKEIRNGTRQFKGGAKIYFSGIKGHWAIESDDWADEKQYFQVIGQQRKSAKWITCWVPLTYTDKWRIGKVYHPKVKSLLEKSEWPGVAIDSSHDQEVWDLKEKNQVREFLNRMSYFYEKRREVESRENWAHHHKIEMFIETVTYLKSLCAHLNITIQDKEEIAWNIADKLSQNPSSEEIRRLVREEFSTQELSEWSTEITNEIATSIHKWWESRT